MRQHERIAYNHWYRKLWRRNQYKWGELFMQIENPYLRVKLACIMLWDGTNYVTSNRDFSGLKLFSDQWTPEIEHGFTEEEVRLSLIHFGYPVKEAKRRSIIPRGNSERYKK